jgi:hypothetical protein
VAVIGGNLKPERLHGWHDHVQDTVRRYGLQRVFHANFAPSTRRGTTND